MSMESLLAENKRLKSQKKRLGLTIAGLFVYPIVNLYLAFWVMLGLGSAHDQWDVIPALGFWTTYLICVAVSTLSGFIHHGNRVAIKTDKEF